MIGCPDCEKLTSGCWRHSQFTIPSQPVYTAPQTGWLCPRCGTSNAPWLTTCGKNCGQFVKEEQP